MLTRAVERGEVKRDGSGVRGDAFRYWLPSLEEKWQTDPWARCLQDAADAAHKVMDESRGVSPG